MARRRRGWHAAGCVDPDQKGRYARGEIGREQFETKKEDLLWALL
jgi:uncharacterized membrane protein